jgi:hypothetical protein
MNLGDKLESYLETAVSSLYEMTKQVNFPPINRQ